KAQISKKLLLSMGGGVHFMGRYIQKLPFVKPNGVMYFTPTSCSTNGASYVTMALSILFGGFGYKPLTVLGTTFHMYTSGSDAKAPFGHFNPKSTGAAKGVKQHLAVTALFTALRTPTAFKDGQVEVVGGSIFDFLVQLPENVSEDLVRSYLDRVGLEFPEVLRVFNEADKVDSRYRWQDTITGLRTGSIVYEDYVQQVLGNIYRMPVGYDNEMSYSFKMNEFVSQLFLVMNRQKDIGILTEAAPLANTEAGSETVQAGQAELAGGSASSVMVSNLAESITKEIDRALEASPRISTRELTSNVSGIVNQLEGLSGMESLKKKLSGAIVRAKLNGQGPVVAKKELVDAITEIREVLGEVSAAAGSSPANKGGIDFRPNALMINYQPMGNFAGLKPTLPTLSSSALQKFDVQAEFAALDNMVDKGFLPSGERIKELLAAASSPLKGGMEGNRERILALLVKIGILEETQCCLQEASNAFKESLVLADSLA
ncbi:MAG: hypothetical protein WC478_04145, partial [Candidatus Omnitrophota bacterium]